MKTSIKQSAAVLAAAAFLTFSAGAAETGAVDFGKFDPKGSKEYVEVNIKSNLIDMVVNLAKKSEPQIAEVLQSLKEVRVNVVGLTEKNHAEMKSRMDSIRAELDEGGWERVVTAIKEDNDVAVFLKMKNSEAVDGVVVTVLEGHEHAVFVNVVGNIRPEKLSLIGERFNIEPLKKLGINTAGN